MNEIEVMKNGYSCGTDTAKWLRSSYKDEKDKVFDGGVKGIPLTRYKRIEEKTSGLQPGIYAIQAKSHCGKTTLLTSLCVDVMNTSVEKKSLVKNVFYTFDDSRDDIRWMMLACMTEISKHQVDRKRTTVEKENAVEEAYEFLGRQAEEGLFIMKGAGQINSLDQLLEDIQHQHDTMKIMFKDNCKLAVYVDGHSKLSAPGSNPR